MYVVVKEEEVVERYEAGKKRMNHKEPFRPS